MCLQWTKVIFDQKTLAHFPLHLTMHLPHNQSNKGLVPTINEQWTTYQKKADRYDDDGHVTCQIKKLWRLQCFLLYFLVSYLYFLREMTMSRSKNSHLKAKNKARWWKALISFSSMRNRLSLVPMEVIVSSEDQCLVATVQKKWRIHHHPPHPLRDRPHSWLTRVWWRKMMSLAKTF